MSKDRDHRDSVIGRRGYTPPDRVVRVRDPWLDADETFRPPDMGEPDGIRDPDRATGDDEARGSPVRLSGNAAREICPGVNTGTPDMLVR